MYAFLSNDSALEALRYLGNDAIAKPAWPEEPRRLPRWGDCVTTQRGLAAYEKEVDLAFCGVTTIPINLLVPEASSRSRGKRGNFHVWKHPVPASSFLRLQNTLFVSKPEFVLLQMASRNIKLDPVAEIFLKEHRAAQEVQAMVDPQGQTPQDDPFDWERKVQTIKMVLVTCEFCGFYRLPAGDKDTQYRLQPLMTREAAWRFADVIPHLYGKARIQTVLDLAFDRSASPRETALALLLSLPVEYGGYGLPRPELNRELHINGFASLWDGGDRITPDLLWDGARLVIEYESDEFHASQGFTKAADDATRANVLSAMGYTVLRVTRGTIASQVQIDRLAREIASLLGVALPGADDITAIRRNKLRALLL